MRRRETFLWLPALVAALVQTAAWAQWVAMQAPELVALAILVQVGSGLALAGVVDRERRALAVVLAVTVPIIGPLALPWVGGMTGRGGAELLADPEPARARSDDGELARQLAASLPPCEAILSGHVELRRATITRLADRAQAEDVAILRWARNQRDPDIAVEAALALEEVGQRFEQRLADARTAAAASPSVETHGALMSTACAGIVNGHVDIGQLERLANEARGHHEAALAFVPAPTTDVELTICRARIELAVRRPVAALAMIKSVIGRSADGELVELYTQAAYAARRFELVSGIARQRASYAIAA